jgi:hypothetical protein
MTLRNAFEELGLEQTLRKILASLNLARTSSDQLRVVIDAGQSNVAVTAIPNVTIGSIAGGQSVNVNAANNTGTMNNTNNTPYNSNTWNAHDIRAEYQELTLQTFQMRRNRWDIT